MINVSLVLYKTDTFQIEYLVNYLNESSIINHIYLVDNSPLRSVFFDSFDVVYIHTGKNLGYGGGHNLAIKESIDAGVKYHLVLNSDIQFELTLLSKLLERIDNDLEIGMIMPKVLNIDGSPQILPKLLPSPFNLLIRVGKPLQRVFKTKNKEYTLEDYYNKELNVPILSGCFSLFRVDALKEVGLYDEKFFMYFEDFDISRRIHSKYKTIYYPLVSITHAHERGAAKSFKLFKIFLKSALIYFNKYGWLIDKERVTINRTVLKNLQ